MPPAEKICITLPPDMAALVRQAVETGDYASNSEVVRDALRTWKIKQRQIRELRNLWEEGITSGPGRFANMAEILEEAQRRFENERENIR